MNRWATVGASLWIAACSSEISGMPDPGADRNHDGIPDIAAGGGGAGAQIPKGSGGATGSAGNGGAGNDAVAAVLPSPTLRRLTLTQYQNSVHDLLGVDPDTSSLSPIPPFNGLQAIGASTVSLPEVDIEVFENQADALSAQLFADTTARQKLTGCDAAQAACAQGFVVKFGRRVFRRPLSDDERTRYLALLAKATEMTGDGWLGLRVITSALLQSPNFLYRDELGEPDPTDPSRRVLSDYQVASRLSFFLWNVTPDDTLLDAAESGALASAAGLLKETKRLLSSARAADAIDDLFGDYLQLDALDSLVKLPEVFPQASDTLGAAMKQETLLSLRELVWKRAGDFRTAFTTDKTFANAELAELYGIAAPQGGGFAEVTLPANGERAGLLTQASFLASHAHPGRSSPTRRGKFIRENLLCQAIAPPPPNVNTSLPETSTAKTLREKLAKHRENAVCNSCHAQMDPIGLALEQFDGIGAFRKTENGVAIDASGELDGVEFDGARGLGTALAANPNVTSCFVRTLVRYARGAVEDSTETALIDDLGQQFAGAGYRMPDLMQAIASHSAFRHVGVLQ
jgi:hypothetical protein